MKIFNPKVIVISRVDSIGDIALTLPMAGILKRQYPLAKIIFLGKSYTAPIIKCSKYIDEIVEWDKIEKQSKKEQLKWIISLNIDIFIHVLPHVAIARLAKKAAIPYRIGTSHYISHFLTCNKRVGFSRSKSDLHESQLNLKLLSPLGITKAYSLLELAQIAGFSPFSKLKDNFKTLLSDKKKNIIFHCKSQGSALEWRVSQFMELAKQLDQSRFKIFFTGTEKEAAFFRDKLPPQENIVDLSGKMTLDDLVAFIAQADLLLAASTGPLHIAGLLNITTIGLYSPRRPLHFGRWQPLGENVFIIEEKIASERDGELKISVEEVLSSISKILGVLI